MAEPATQFAVAWGVNVVATLERPIRSLDGKGKIVVGSQ